MHIPKRYGHSKTENCPFCNKQGVVKNRQGIAVCIKHKDSSLEEIKCVCGEYLESRDGKYGAYFNCMNCGNISLGKVMKLESVKEIIWKKKPAKKNSFATPEKKEIFVTSDELDFM